MGAIQESINKIGKSALEATVAKGAKRLSEAEKIRSAAQNKLAAAKAANAKANLVSAQTQAALERTVEARTILEGVKQNKINAESLRGEWMKSKNISSNLSMTPVSYSPLDSIKGGK